MRIGRSDQADAFLAAAGDAAPDAVSACAGWTTHDVTAHVTGNAIEVVRHLRPYLQGDAVPVTRSFEKREAPLLDHSVGELGRILLVAGRRRDPDPDTDFRVRLRSEGHRDLRVVVDAGTATLTWADDDPDEPGPGHRPGRPPPRHLGSTARPSRAGPQPTVPTRSRPSPGPARRLLTGAFWP